MKETKQRKNISKQKFPYWIEKELQEKLQISPARFHKVHGDQWEAIYQMITDKFADKTKIWKNGLHWANTNGYSPKSMKNCIGCYQAEYQSWFFKLPELIQENDPMVYFLLDCGGDWFTGEHFLLFEGYLSELVQVLSLFTQTAFLGLGSIDYYLVSKKYQWIIGYNHHDVVSLLGDGLNPLI